MKALIRKGLENSLPPGYDIDTHFKPRYNPWDQRMCLVPDGDLFEAICDGPRVGGDRPDRDLHRDRPPAGIGRGARGRPDRHRDRARACCRWEACRSSVDGRDVELPKTMAYKGMMLSGVPNLAVAFGYTNASWTLKCDLTCEYVCRLLRHMDEHGYRPGDAREPRPLGHRGAVHRLHLGLRAARHRQVPEAGLEGARGGCTRTTPATSCAEVRNARGRRAGVLRGKAVKRV